MSLFDPTLRRCNRCGRRLPPENFADVNVAKCDDCRAKQKRPEVNFKRCNTCKRFRTVDQFPALLDMMCSACRASRPVDPRYKQCQTCKMFQPITLFYDRHNRSCDACRARIDQGRAHVGAPAPDLSTREGVNAYQREAYRQRRLMLEERGEIAPARVPKVPLPFKMCRVCHQRKPREAFPGDRWRTCYECERSVPTRS